MKNRRNPLNVDDFSGGLLTLPNQIADIKEQYKYTPDCMNVYAEGRSLRKRFGVAKLNSSSAGTMGNGIYNWVLSITQQYLIGLFDSTLKQMSVNGTSWSGTWVTVNADTAGTTFSNSIMHFVTYQGTLIMTTEARDKPQRMTPTDTKYKNLDFGGTGIAPLAKYPQVWKEHVFMLNISGGGQLTEDCASLSSWTTLDVSAGVTTTSSFGGLQSFKFQAGAGAGSDAHIKRTLASLTTSYSVEIKTYFSALSAITGGDYAYMDIANGVVRFRTRWSQGGLETFNGTTWLQIGVGLVTTGTWNTWKYLVTAGTASAAFVDVLKDGIPAGLQFSIANASAASSGQVDIACNAGGSGSQGLWYMDYIYVNSIAVRSNYYTDGVFNSWVSASQASYTDNVLPRAPFLQYKLNDNTNNSTITDTGSGSANAAMYINNTTLNTSVVSAVGKIGSAISFTSASIHNIRIATTTLTSMTADIFGAFSVWVKPNILTGTIVSMSRATGLANIFDLSISGNNVFCELIHDSGTPTWRLLTDLTVNVGSWNHIALSQNGVTPSVYVNGSLANPTFSFATDKTAWLSSLATVDTGRINGYLVQGNAIASLLDGSVDDVRYYRTALSSADVQALYAEGNGTEGQPVTVREGTTIYTGTFSYRVNNDGQYAVVSQTLSSSTSIIGTALVMGAFINATNLSTYKLRVNDGTNNYDTAVITANGTWQYQSLSFTPMSNSSSIVAQVISLSSSTVFIDMVSIVATSTGSLQDLSDRLQRSVSGTYDTWTGSDSGTNDITTPGDVGLTGSFILQDRMYVMKAWNIYRITYTGSIPLLDIKQARSVVGTKSPRSIKNIDLTGIGEVVIFLGTDRNLYLFDGFSSSVLTDGIQLDNNIAPVFTNNINTQALDKVYAVNHSDLGFYEIFLPIGASVVPNYSLVYDYKNKSFWPHSNRNFSCGNVSDDGSGQRVIMVSGASNGTTYQLDVGSTDDGTAINSYWTSFKLGVDYSLNKFDEFLMATESVACTPTFQWRCNYETTYITKVLKTSTHKHDFDPSRIDNLIQFKISDNSTSPSFKIWHVRALERTVGIGT